MTAQKGKDLLLKIDSDGEGTFTTVAGLRSRRIAFNAETVDVTDADSAGRWRELLEGAGVKRASIAGSGIFRDAGTDATVHAALTRYDHIVVDEAQEFAPIELAVIGRARAESGSITIAGDENQQVDETIVFTSWPELTAELGVAHTCERVVLRESYRCPPAVEAFARSCNPELVEAELLRKVGVLWVDGAAGDHGRPGREDERRAALQDKDVEVGPVTHEDHCRRVADRRHEPSLRGTVTCPVWKRRTRGVSCPASRRCCSATGSRASPSTRSSSVRPSPARPTRAEARWVPGERGLGRSSFATRYPSLPSHCWVGS